jgi:hypothetical protein
MNKTTKTAKLPNIAKFNEDGYIYENLDIKKKTKLFFDINYLANNASKIQMDYVFGSGFLVNGNKLEHYIRWNWFLKEAFSKLYVHGYLIYYIKDNIPHIPPYNTLSFRFKKDEYSIKYEVFNIKNNLISKKHKIFVLDEPNDEGIISSNCYKAMIIQEKEDKFNKVAYEAELSRLRPSLLGIYI